MGRGVCGVISGSPGRTMREHPTILIVDDNPVNVKLLETILKSEGYPYFSAFNGPEARRLAQANRPDLILLDIMMPEESGFETCQLLKRNVRTAEIPIIFLSARTDVDSKVEGLDLGAVDYITKPFNKAEVLARMRRHLETRQSYQSIIDAQAAKLKQVKDAQQAILARPDDLPQARFGVIYVPIVEAGGDFYEVFQIDPNLFGYFIADISGHDIRASYNTFALKALISQNACPDIVPEETMKIINRVFINLMKDGEHLTACYAHLDREKMELTVINAGHLPALWVNAAGDASCLEGTGDILGSFDDVFFEPLVQRVEEGDRLFLYTDGLIEEFGGKSRTREEGIEELKMHCADTRDLPIDEAVHEIASRLHARRSDLQDDVLLLGVEI